MDKFSLILLLLFGLQWFKNVSAIQVNKLIDGNPVHHSSSGIKVHNSVDPCSCHKSCQSLSGSKEQGTILQSYVYDAEVGSCVQPPSSCVSDDATCAFSTEQACMAQCGDRKGGKTRTKQSGCKTTKHGCCPDGSSRPKNGKCSDSVNSSSDSSLSMAHGVRWDLVASGLCVLVLLVAVLSVSGVMAYHYRERQRERIRSRYIHNVLEMYESDSDTSATEGTAHKYKQETTTDMVTQQPFIQV